MVYLTARGDPMNNSACVELVSNLRWSRRTDPAAVMLQRVDTGHVFLIGEPEWLILQSFDGSPLETIRERLEARHTFTFSDGELEAFILRSYKSGLLTIDGRASSATRSRGKGWRLPLGNPERIITWLAPRCRPLFHPISVLCAVGLLICALMLWAFDTGDHTASVAALPFWTRATIAVTVVIVVGLLHEFAHALTLHRHGGSVREMGLTTVALCPCFYCDITDSYLLPHKRQRIAVALAGPFAQAVAGAAGWTWLSLASPWSLAMQFALICVSVLGLLSVANLFPFARTDGYYVLTEILDAPNLRRRAWQWLKRLLRGFPATDDRDRGSPWAFWLYAVPSAAFSAWVASRLLLALSRWMAPIMAGIVACA
ncbi:MAG: hypothetical protein ACRD96_02485, partial [Bryobacteraceae bacterium]